MSNDANRAHTDRLPVPVAPSRRPRAGLAARLLNLRRPVPSAASTRSASTSSGLYVDIENLPGTINARRIVDAVLDQWPVDRPAVRALRVYAPADKTALWHAWCADRLPDVRIRGVQRFRRESSKNSADLALAADAAADFATGAVQFVAVLSSDSDFASLYVKIAELAAEAGLPCTPFLWITPVDGSPVSSEVADYFPDHLRWALPSTGNGGTAAARTASPGPGEPTPGEPTPDAIAAALLAALPKTKQLFRASDARPIVAKRWPGHPAVRDPSAFGIFLANEIYPTLAERGVTVVSAKSPRTYGLPRRFSPDRPNRPLGRGWTRAAPVITTAMCHVHQAAGGGRVAGALLETPTKAERPRRHGSPAPDFRRSRPLPRGVPAPAPPTRARVPAPTPPPGSDQPSFPGHEHRVDHGRNIFNSADATDATAPGLTSAAAFRAYRPNR